MLRVLKRYDLIQCYADFGTWAHQDGYVEVLCASNVGCDGCRNHAWEVFEPRHDFPHQAVQDAELEV